MYARPASPEIAHLTGTAHVLTGIATGQTAQTEIGTVHLNEAMDGPVTVIVRPEQVRYEPSVNGPCELIDLRYVTPGYRAQIKTPTGTLGFIEQKTQQFPQKINVYIDGPCHSLPHKLGVYP